MRSYAGGLGLPHLASGAPPLRQGLPPPLDRLGLGSPARPPLFLASFQLADWSPTTRAEPMQARSKVDGRVRTFPVRHILPKRRQSSAPSLYPWPRVIRGVVGKSLRPNSWRSSASRKRSAIIASGCPQRSIAVLSRNPISGTNSPGAVELALSRRRCIEVANSVRLAPVFERRALGENAK